MTDQKSVKALRKEAHRMLRVSDWRAGFDGLSDEKRLGRTVIDGVTIEAATDGRAIAIVADEHSVLPEYPDGLAVPKTIAEIWRHVISPHAIRVKVGDLLTAIGRVDRPRAMNCEACGGSGRDPRSDDGCDCACCACEECEGGRCAVEPEAKKRYVPGFLTTFDANLLGLALTAIHGLDANEVVTFSDMQPAMNAVMVAGDRWRVVAMLMRRFDGEPEWQELRVGGAQ